VHFLEGVCERKEYARALLRSLERKPQYQTIMMLSRFLLDAEIDDLRHYISAIERISQDTRADEDVLTAAKHFLDKAMMAGRMNYYPGY
jgi:hypothetical protein